VAKFLLKLIVFTLEERINSPPFFLNPLIKAFTIDSLPPLGYSRYEFGSNHSLNKVAIAAVFVSCIDIPLIKKLNKSTQFLRKGSFR